MTEISRAALRQVFPTSHRPFSKSEIEQSIPARFEKQVRLHPARTAVQAGGSSVTYEELNARANAVARGVRDRIGMAEEPVALLFEQGIDSIAATLGTLKAGKIYVPLSPDAPESAVAHALEDSRARLILTDAAHGNRAARFASPSRPLLILDHLGRPTAGADAAPNLSPGRLASIYYTSGSTGAPKGVFDCHRNILHNVMRYTNSLGITEEDRLTLLQGPAFSGCASSIFGALLNGAAVFPFDLRREGFPAAARWLADQRLTIYHSVPALFARVVECAGSLPHLRLVRLEGDRCARRHVQIFQDHFRDGSLLVNGLGATETGLSRQYFVEAITALGGPGVPVGYAVEDVSVAVVDADGREAQPGEVGEIVVRSSYLARGYWRKAEQTRSRFREEGEGVRSFWSGDLGRMGSDGCLEHLGRRDFQVRVRGIFVDGPAVEAALQRIPGIREARVLTREDVNGDARLVAYYAPFGESPTVTMIRKRLSSELPDVAVPSVYVPLVELPLDENGKVDPRRLPPPGKGRPRLEVPYAAPRTPTERLLVSLWSEVLGIDGIGVNDDFFELGGDSLDAGQLTARLRRAFAREIPLRTVFDEPTVSRQANAILPEAGVEAS